MMVLNYIEYLTKHLIESSRVFKNVPSVDYCLWACVIFVTEVRLATTQF